MYVPGIRPRMLYTPDSFVTADVTTPVALFVVLMETPGRTAPEESKAVPVSVALLACPNAAVAHRHDKSARNAVFPAVIKNLFMLPPRNDNFLLKVVY
jgi:hypothetical protein